MMSSLKATSIPNAGRTNQVWMAEPFEINTWYAGTLRAENKGDELHVGARFKLDLPAPAWLLPVGIKPGNIWVLSAISKDSDEPPSALAVAVIGPCLVKVVEDEAPPTPTPEPEPTPTPTPEPTPTPTPEPTPTPTPDPGETRIDQIVIVRMSALPIVVKGGICFALEDDLLDAVLEKIVQTIGAQRVRTHLRNG